MPSSRSAGRRRVLKIPAKSLDPVGQLNAVHALETLYPEGVSYSCSRVEIIKGTAQGASAPVLVATT